MTQATNDVATVQKTSTVVDGWWDTDSSAYDEIEGYDLVKEEALFSLVGVPFQISKIVFRDGVQRKGCEWRDDYASLELRVAPETILRQQKARILSRRSGKLITDKTGIASPGEFLVINNGGTGIYRQSVEYLWRKQLIVLPEGPEEGEKGECIFDLPRSRWLDGAEMLYDNDGHEVYRAEFDLSAMPWRATRGLRYSDYTNEYTTPGETALTWYIA